MQKLLSLLLAVCVLTLSFPANSQYLRGLDPSECTPEKPSCVCYLPNALELISEELRKMEICTTNLASYKAFAEDAQKPVLTAWYQEPSIIVGGLVLSVSLAGFLGYYLGRN